MKTTVDEIKSILYEFANNKIDKNSIEHIKLYELLKSHPKANEKIGCGVDYFFVQRSKWKTNQFNFMIYRLDGSTTDFSFHKCFTPNMPSSKNINFPIIFRNTVKDQIDDFRTSAFNVVGKGDKFICSQTNLKFKKIYSHVDHVYPLTFESIYNEFINLNKLNLNEIKLSNDKGNSEARHIIDQNIVNAFSEFHKTRAVLRIVCSSANLQAKHTKNYNGENPTSIKKKLIEIYPQYHIK